MQKLEFINIAYNMLDKKAYDDLCMDEEEIKSYENGERDPYIVFEGDPDYMIDDN